ncbi:MAG: histidine phosphatase family protein [Microvirga sp.]
MKSFQPASTAPTPRPRTTVLLVRHAATDTMSCRLTGRDAAVPLNALGEQQAEALAGAVARVSVDAIYSSPLARACATAAPLAASRHLPIHIEEDLTEINFGEWTGLTFETLSRRPEWQAYNAARSGSHIPGGETAAAACARIGAALSRFHLRHPGGTVAAFTHAELVRYAVLLARRQPLDRWAEIDVPPASIAVLECDASGVRELTGARFAIPA